MATAEEIRDKAAKKLYVLSTGQTLRSEIAADLTEAYKEVYAALDAMSLITWDFDDEVPDEFVWPVVSLVAMARANEYAVPVDHYQRLAVDANGATRHMRELLASNVYETPKADYF